MHNPEEMEPTQSVIRRMLYRGQGATGLSQTLLNCAETADFMRPCGDMMGSVAELSTEPAVNPSALAGVRILISTRIEKLDVAAADIESALAQGAARGQQLRTRLLDAEARWADMMSVLPDRSPADIDAAFRAVAAAGADLAAAEEQTNELGVRLNGVRSEQEVLRSVYRSLDDLMASTNTPEVGSSRLRSASRQVFQIIEEERMRIARDMHDGPAQSMANLVLQAEILERLIVRDPQMVVSELADFKNGVRDALEETRRLIFDLRPMTLDDLGLVPTLRKFVREFAEKTAISARFHLVGEERRLPSNYEAVVFRIVQEALTNVRKHARARTVEVTLTLQPRRVVAIVKDDGEGFDVAATEARLGRTRNLGLISMRERADLEKGHMEIRSQIGRGTEAKVTFNL